MPRVSNLEEQLQDLLARGVELKEGMPSLMSSSMVATPYLTKQTTDAELQGWEEEVRLALAARPLLKAQFDAERQRFDLAPWKGFELPKTTRLKRRLENLEKIIKEL